MEEQSHKDEMRAALRGDFERMRKRQAREGEPITIAAPAAVVRPEDPPVGMRDASSGSWLERLLGRA